MSRRMIPTENVEVKPDGQLILQRNTKDVVVKGDAVFTGDIDAQNGVLQIDQIVLPAGAPQSLKKIYYHPIYITDNVNATIRFSITILDNQAAAYTKETLLVKLKALMDAGAFINVNGFVKDTSNNRQPAYMMQKAGSVYRINYFVAGSNSGDTVDFETTYASANVTITDGVNPIN